MEALIKELPYAGWIIAIVVLTLGGAAAFYMLDGFRSKKKKEQNDGDDRLITILQTTVTELEKKVNKQTTDIENLTQQVRRLREERETLKEVLQGRDAQTQEFYKQAFDAMKVGHETHAMVSELVGTMKGTNENMTRLIEVISKHVDVIDHATVAQNKA